MRKVTLTHFINDKEINSYILDLIVEPRRQVPQIYELPQLEDGNVTIIMDCEYGERFSVEYDTDDLYKNGLLIYTASDLDTTIEIDGIVYFDRYICFKAGESQKAFTKKAGSAEFVAVDNPPKLKRIERKWTYYSPVPYDKNKWVMQ